MQNPWTLLALTTLALPWLFLRRRRPTTPPPRVSFPAVCLLAPTLRRAVRRKERRLLILASARTCALFLLVLIWAGPPRRVSLPSSTAALPTAVKSSPASASQRVADGKIDGRPLRILIVDGGDSGPPFPNDAQLQNAADRSSDAVFYLAAALNPNFDATSPAANVSFPQTELVSSTEFALTTVNALAAFDAIFWVDLSAPTNAELVKIERFFAASPRSPRALLIFAGPRTDATRWDAVWRRWNLDAQTLSVAFEPATGALAASTDDATRRALRQIVNNNVKEQAFFDAFAGLERSGANSFPIWRSFPLVGSDAVPLLRDAPSSSPTLTLLSAPYNGVVVWSATAPDASVSALAFAPSFVPLTERIVEFALNESLANLCNSIGSNARLSPETFADRDAATPKNADATLDKTSARRHLNLDLVLWSVFGVLAAFEFWRSASLARPVPEENAKTLPNQGLPTD